MGGEEVGPCGRTHSVKFGSESSGIGGDTCTARKRYPHTCARGLRRAVSGAALSTIKGGGSWLRIKRKREGQKTKEAFPTAAKSQVRLCLTWRSQLFTSKNAACSRAQLRATAVVSRTGATNAPAYDEAMERCDNPHSREAQRSMGERGKRNRHGAGTRTSRKSAGNVVLLLIEDGDSSTVCSGAEERLTPLGLSSSRAGSSSTLH